MFDTKTPPDLARDVGARLRDLRLQRNMTQIDLARRAGVSRPTIGSLERRGQGTIETLARVLYVLGRERELEALLAPDPPSTLEDLSRRKKRERARP